MQRVGDHPRLCGEKTLISNGVHISTGSPPPMRGKEGIRNILTILQGITPAYAGKSTFNFRIVFRHEDHPRLCGEKENYNHSILA